MELWRTIVQTLEAQGSCVLVTVARGQGSVPREPGARLLVVPGSGFRGTIGGGTLEWQALAQAQGDLGVGRKSFRLRDFALGPELGQCCGGRVTLAFEVLDRSDLETARAFAAREAKGRFRTVGHIAGDRLDRHLSDQAAGPASGPDVQLTEDGSLHETFGAPRRRIFLFGAGHVGRALAMALAPLPFRVTWVDPRGDAFPAILPAAIDTVSASNPVAVLDSAETGAFVVVMTHSHALDLALVGRALALEAPGYVGVIGSATKRRRFERRLAGAGLPAARLAELICPIGVAGIESKEPAAIAAGVAAQLLIRDSALTASTAGATPGTLSHEAAADRARQRG